VLALKKTRQHYLPMPAIQANHDANQLVKFNVGGKIFYTTRETIMNSCHHTAQYNHDASSSSQLVFSNCLPFSHAIRLPTSSSQQPVRNTPPPSNNQTTSGGSASASSSSSSLYNSLSTFVDLHNRKNRLSVSEAVQPQITSGNTVSRHSTTFDNYFTRLLDENQHLGIIRDENGCFFIDRSPKYFALIIEYLKSGELNLFDSAEYRSSELDTPEYGFHDLQLFAQKIIKEADYFMIDVSDQLYNIVGDQLYVSDSFQDRIFNRANQRCLIFFDKDPLRKPCSLYMNGIWFDRHIIDKECFVRNGVIEIYMDNENEKKKNNSSNQQFGSSGNGFGVGSYDHTDSDFENQFNKRRSLAHGGGDYFSSSLSTGGNNASRSSNSYRLQFVIHPQVEVKSNEKRTMMNFIGMDPSLFDTVLNTPSGTDDISPNTSSNVDYSTLFSTYGMLGSSRRLSMEYPQVVENVLVVKDTNSFKKEFRLKEVTEPSMFKVQFNKKYFNLLDYNHSIKMVRDDKDRDHITIVETFAQVPEKFGTGNIENNPNIVSGFNTVSGATSGKDTSRRGALSEINFQPIGKTLSNLSDDAKQNSDSKNMIEGNDLYVEVASSDEDDEFTVPQPVSTKRKSLNPGLLKSKSTTKQSDQTRETRMRVIRNNFFAKSKREFIYIESKNRVYWASASRGLITLELSNKNL